MKRKNREKKRWRIKIMIKQVLLERSKINRRRFKIRGKNSNLSLKIVRKIKKKLNKIKFSRSLRFNINRRSSTTITTSINRKKIIIILGNNIILINKKINRISIMNRGKQMKKMFKTRILKSIFSFFMKKCW